MDRSPWLRRWRNRSIALDEILGYPIKMSGRLADITGPDIPELISDDSVILLPVGAIEQHGPHLPMSVDTVIAEETSVIVL